MLRILFAVAAMLAIGSHDVSCFLDADGTQDLSGVQGVVETIRDDDAGDSVTTRFSPEPLTHLRFVSKRIIDGETVGEWRLLAQQLEERQAENMNKIRTLYCEEWRNQLNPGEGLGTVALHQNWWDRENDALKMLMKYPPRAALQPNKRIPIELYVPVAAKIRTRAMTVDSERFLDYESGSLFPGVKIGMPEEPHDGTSSLELSYHWLKKYRSPNEFWARIVDLVNTGFYELKVLRHGDVIQFTFYRSLDDLDRYQLWQFDLRQGGFATYSENRVTRNMIYADETVFELISDCWVPIKSVRYEHDALNDRCLKQSERNWFGHQVNVDMSKEFDIQSLPLVENAQVVDRRTRNERLFSVPKQQ